MITKEMFNQWRGDPVTQQVMRQTREIRQWHVERLATGGTLCQVPGTAEETAKVVGIIYGIDLLLEIKPPDEEETDGESEQVVSS